VARKNHPKTGGIARGNPSEGPPTIGMKMKLRN